MSRLTALIAKAEAGGTEISTDGDPAVITKEEVLDDNAKFFNNIAEALRTPFVR